MDEVIFTSILHANLCFFSQLLFLPCSFFEFVNNYFFVNQSCKHTTRSCFQRWHLLVCSWNNLCYDSVHSIVKIRILTILRVDIRNIWANRVYLWKILLGQHLRLFNIIVFRFSKIIRIDFTCLHAWLQWHSCWNPICWRWQLNRLREHIPTYVLW